MNRVVMIDRDSFNISENIRCAILGETVFHKSALVPENISILIFLRMCYKSVFIKYYYDITVLQERNGNRILVLPCIYSHHICIT